MPDVPVVPASGDADEVSVLPEAASAAVQGGAVAGAAVRPDPAVAARVVGTASAAARVDAPVMAVGVVVRTVDADVNVGIPPAGAGSGNVEVHAQPGEPLPTGYAIVWADIDDVLPEGGGGGGMTPEEADDRYVNVDGDTMTGSLMMQDGDDDTHWAVLRAGWVEPVGHATLVAGSDSLVLRAGEAHPVLIESSLQVVLHAPNVSLDGSLTLAIDPEGPMDAATRQYVDAAAGGGGDTIPHTGTYATDPGTPEIKVVNDYYDGDVDSRDNLQIVSAGVLTGWLNEWGAYRARQPLQNITDAAVRLVRGSDTIPVGNQIEVVDSARTKVLHAVTGEGRVVAPNVKDRLSVIAAAAAASTALEGAYVRSGVVPLGRWHGSGVLDGTTLATNIYGSRDIPFSVVSARQPTVTAETLPMTYNVTAQYVGYQFAGTQVVLARFRFRISAASVASWEIFRLLNSATVLGRVRLAGTAGNANAIRILNASGSQVAESSGALVAGTTYTLNVRFEQGASNNTMRVWATDTAGAVIAGLDVSGTLPSVGGGSGANLVTEADLGPTIATGVSPTATYSTIDVAAGTAGATSEAFPVLTTEAVELASRTYVDTRSAPVLILGAAAPVPGGTPAGTVIVRT